MSFPPRYGIGSVGQALPQFMRSSVHPNTNGPGNFYGEGVSLNADSDVERDANVQDTTLVSQAVRKMITLRTLTKDCLYHLMSFLPSPTDKRNLVMAINNIQATQAFKEPSLWREWEELNVVDSLFLLHPKVLCMVLNNVKEIRKIFVKFEEENLFPCHEIINSIQQTDKKEWNAIQLEVDIRLMANAEPIFVELISTILDKLGTSVLTVKIHANERSMINNHTVIDMFFESVISTDKFNSVTSLDLNAFGRDVGVRLEEVLNKMSLNHLELSGLHNIVPTALNSVMAKLETLIIHHCGGILPEVFLKNFVSGSLAGMKDVIISCKDVFSAARWHGVCRQCFNHCNFELIVTEPLATTMEEQIQYGQEQNIESLKGILQNYVETQLLIDALPAVSHQITLGQRYNDRGLHCVDIRRMQVWLNQFGFISETSECRVEYKVKESCRIVFLCCGVNFR